MQAPPYTRTPHPWLVVTGEHSDIPRSELRHEWLLHKAGKTRGQVTFSPVRGGGLIRDDAALPDGHDPYVLYVRCCSTKQHVSEASERVASAYNYLNLSFVAEQRRAYVHYCGKFHSFGALQIFVFDKDALRSVATFLRGFESRRIYLRFRYGGFTLFFSTFTPVYVLTTLTHDSVMDVFGSTQRAASTPELGMVMDDTIHVDVPLLRKSVLRRVVSSVAQILGLIPPVYEIEEPPAYAFGPEVSEIVARFPKGEDDVQYLTLPSQLVYRPLNHPVVVYYNCPSANDQILLYRRHAIQKGLPVIVILVAYDEEFFDLVPVEGEFRCNASIGIVNCSVNTLEYALTSFKTWRERRARHLNKARISDVEVCVETLGLGIVFMPGTHIYMYTDADLTNRQMESLRRLYPSEIEFVNERV